jgi:oligopeptide transport system substrate-binding protein
VTYPVPRHIVELYGDAWTAPEKIITNGPFVLESRTPRQLTVLVRNPEYQGRFTGNVERVELGYRTDRYTELQLYEADRLDLSSLWFLSGGEIERVRQRFADDYLSRPGLNTQYVGFNVRCPPFDDRRVRRALVMAIDRETLADVVLGGYTFPATGGFIPPGIPGHSPEIGLPYDPEQARQLLAEAGFPEGRNFPGVEWWTPAATDVISDFLRAQWRENLGIDIPWQIYADASFYERLEQTKPHMFRIGWKADYPDPDNFLRVGMFLKETGWRNESYEDLVERARRITDQEERMKLYQQADRILIEEAVVLPYVYVVGHVLVKPWVARYPTSPIKSAFWKDVIIEPH